MFPTEPVPERIGAYKVIRRLTGSGSADMYLGRMDGPMGFQRVCALKLVPNAIEGDVRLAEELAREASICARLNHPAIVRMFDFFEHDRRLVLVLEHVEGADLDRLLQNLTRRRQKLGDEAIWYLGRELVGALAHAHAATDENGSVTPVIHRNLQPENVLVSWEGQVRLTGFGLGKILGRTPDTVVGTIKGTPGYMAPEQARGERVTPRADVYGFGVLLWSLLTGRRPPSDGTRLESVSKIRTDIPREIAAAIDAALEPSPDKRKITCTEIEQWLGKVAKIEPGKAELREKILMLRGARSPVGEAGATDTTRPRAMPRRKVSLRGIRASQRPAGPGPLSAPPPPSTRSALRASERPATSPQPRAGTGPQPPPRVPREAAAWKASIPDVGAIDQILDESPLLSRESLATKPDGRRPVQKTLLGGLTAAAAQALASPPQAAPTEPPASASPPAPIPQAMQAELEAAPPATGDAAAWQDVGEQAPPVVASEEGTARPAPRPPKRSTRPLSALESIGVASVTAGIVVGIGILVADRSPPRPAPPPTLPPGTLVPAARPEPSPLGGGTTVPPQPTSTGSAEAGMDLPGGFGYITVVSPVNAMVFVNGGLAGPTNEPVKATCGRRFVRLGTVNEGVRFPAWVAPGRTVIIPCQAAVTVEIRPSPSPQ